MARTKAQLPGGARLADYLALGYLAMNCPVDRVRAVRAVLAANFSMKARRYQTTRCHGVSEAYRRSHRRCAALSRSVQRLKGAGSTAGLDEAATRRNKQQRAGFTIDLPLKRGIVS
jgi:hypothetical protein